MNKTLLGVTTALSLAALSLAISTPATADNDRRHQHQRETHYAKIIRVQPIFQTVRVAYEEQNCRHNTVSEKEYRLTPPKSPAKLLLGGLIGGTIGHELGKNHNRDLATFTGAIIGSSIAHNAGIVYYPTEGNSLRHQQHCRTQIQYKNERKLVGYDVTYRYQGRLYTLRTQERPGAHIRIDDETRHQRNRGH